VEQVRLLFDPEVALVAVHGHNHVLPVFAQPRQKGLPDLEGRRPVMAFLHDLGQGERQAAIFVFRGHREFLEGGWRPSLPALSGNEGRSVVLEPARLVLFAET
jgi:hypothetical protein